jgi:hypothetical protein
MINEGEPVMVWVGGSILLRSFLHLSHFILVYCLSIIPFSFPPLPSSVVLPLTLLLLLFLPSFHLLSFALSMVSLLLYAISAAIVRKTLGGSQKKGWRPVWKFLRSIALSFYPSIISSECGVLLWMVVRLLRPLPYSTVFFSSLLLILCILQNFQVPPCG